MSGVVPSEEFNEQLKRTVREVLRRERSQQRPVGRWHKKGGGGSGIVRVQFNPTGPPVCDAEIHDGDSVKAANGTVVRPTPSCVSLAGLGGLNAAGVGVFYDTTEANWTDKVVENGSLSGAFAYADLWKVSVTDEYGNTTCEDRWIISLMDRDQTCV